MGYNAQARKWLMVINNPAEAGLGHAAITEIVLKFHPTYFCMADEIATTEPFTRTSFLYPLTCALFHHQKAVSTAHIERAYGTPRENKEYISKTGVWADTDKVETSVPGTFAEWGEAPGRQRGQSAGKCFNLCRNCVPANPPWKFLKNIPILLSVSGTLNCCGQTILAGKYSAENRKLEVTYLYGASGVGKTWGIFEQHDPLGDLPHYQLPGCKGISFDGYNGQDVLVFEEFNSQVPIEDMLNYLDIYPLHLPARYNDRVACYTKVYLTSNLPLEKQYRAEQWDRPETWRAFLRRIHNVIEYLPDGSTVQHKKGGFPL